MTLDNSKTIIGQRIRLFIATVLFLAFIVMTYIAKIIKFPLLGMNDTIWTLILTAIFLLILLFPMFLNYQYIYYSDEEDTIIFRYFTSGAFGGRKNSVEIKKGTFAGYKMESSHFGIVKAIILFQRVKKDMAKYPPIYINALSKEERKKIFMSLNKFINPA